MLDIKKEKGGIETPWEEVGMLQISEKLFC